MLLMYLWITLDNLRKVLKAQLIPLAEPSLLLVLVHLQEKGIDEQSAYLSSTEKIKHDNRFKPCKALLYQLSGESSALSYLSISNIRRRANSSIRRA